MPSSEAYRREMNYAEFTEAIRATGISINKSAKLFMVDTRTVRRWASGEYTVPSPVAAMIRVMIRAGVDVRDAIVDAEAPLSAADLKQYRRRLPGKVA